MTHDFFAKENPADFDQEWCEATGNPMTLTPSEKAAMSDDLLKRLDDYSSEVATRINRGVVPFCHLGASVVGPMCKEAAARIRDIEAQLSRSYEDGKDAQFNADLRRGEI